MADSKEGPKTPEDRSQETEELVLAADKAGISVKVLIALLRNPDAVKGFLRIKEKHEARVALEALVAAQHDALLWEIHQLMPLIYEKLKDLNKKLFEQGRTLQEVARGGSSAIVRLDTFLTQAELQELDRVNLVEIRKHHSGPEGLGKLDFHEKRASVTTADGVEMDCILSRGGKLIFYLR